MTHVAISYILASIVFMPSMSKTKEIMAGLLLTPGMSISRTVLQRKVWARGLKVHTWTK